jgi:hypothetical protein
MNVIYYIVYLYWFIQVYMSYAYGFLHNNVILRRDKYIKSASQDFHYEYKYDWISGEVPWEFIETDNIDDYSIVYDTNVYDKEILDTQYSHIKMDIVDTTIIDIEIINPELENNMIISKAIVSGAMKGIYIQIMSIDNMITYTQCYTNKIIDMDILLSLGYIIFYKTNKNNEKNNLIILKKYNNIQLFEKYVKIRRTSMFVIIMLYVLLFRGVTIAE